MKNPSEVLKEGSGAKMSNEITLEQIEQWAKAGVPVKDFSKDGSAVVLVSPPYAKNFEDAWNMFFRI